MTSKGLFGGGFRCTSCGGTNVMAQLWTPLNQIKPLDITVPGIEPGFVGQAPVDAHEAAWDIVGYEGAWCPDCREHVEATRDEEG